MSKPFDKTKTKMNAEVDQPPIYPKLIVEVTLLHDIKQDTGHPKAQWCEYPKGYLNVVVLTIDNEILTDPCCSICEDVIPGLTIEQYAQEANKHHLKVRGE